MIEEERFSKMTPARQKRILAKRLHRLKILAKRERNDRLPDSMPNPVPEGFDFEEDKKNKKERGLGHGKAFGRRYNGQLIFRTSQRS